MNNWNPIDQCKSKSDNWTQIRERSLISDQLMDCSENVHEIDDKHKAVSGERIQFYSQLVSSPLSLLRNEATSLWRVSKPSNWQSTKLASSIFQRHRRAVRNLRCEFYLENRFCIETEDCSAGSCIVHHKLRSQIIP